MAVHRGALVADAISMIARMPPLDGQRATQASRVANRLLPSGL
jgi:hypothetical protein